MARAGRRSAGHVGVQHSDERIICVCLDDFGLHPGINDAALRLTERGRLQAISCMVGSAFFGDGAAQLRRLDAGAVDIGLHLDLTEAPLMASSKRALRGLIGASLLGRLDRTALRAEIRDQLDTFEQAIGRPPTYIDGHQHVHQLPGIRDELLDELCSRSMNVVPWLRSTRGAAHGNWRSRFKPMVIEMLGDAAMRNQAHRRGFAQNAHLLGVYDFTGGAQAYAHHLARWLDAAGNGDLLMCHAASGSAADDPIAGARQAEFDVLGSSRFDDLLASRRITLQPMSRLLTGPHPG